MYLSLEVLGCVVPMILLFYTLVYTASNMALSVALLTKGTVTDEEWDLATTLMLQGVLMSIACAMVIGLCVTQWYH